VETVVTSSAITPCRAYIGSVEAVSDANGTGQPGYATKWTLPVPPSAFNGATGVPQTHSVQLSWNNNGNASPVFIIEDSVVSATDNFTTRETSYSGTAYTDYSLPGDTTCYFRIRAVNGEGRYSDMAGPIMVQSSTSGGGGGPNCTISHVKINGRTYIPGEVISATPVITAVVTGDVNPSYVDGAVIIDWDQNAPIVIPGSSITYELVPGLPPDGYQMTINVVTPINASPVNGHTIRISCKSNSNNVTTWQGNFAVMSGKVQVIGPAYNFPNPFKPLSTNPGENATRIAYNLNVDATVTLIIYDITGHEVRRTTYFNGTEGGRAGINQVEWNGHSIFGETVGNGMYIYKIISGNRVIGTGKIVVLD
jgi:hypothetical protein